MSMADLFAALGGGFQGYGDWSKQNDAKKLEQQRMAMAEKARQDDIAFRNDQATKQDLQTQILNKRAEDAFKAQQDETAFNQGRAAFSDTAPNVDLTGLAAEYARKAGVGKDQQFLPDADAPQSNSIFDALAGKSAMPDLNGPAFQPITSKFVRPENVQERSSRIGADAAQTRIDQAARESSLWQQYAALPAKDRNGPAGDAILMQVIGKQPGQDFKNDQALHAQDNAAALQRTIAGSEWHDATNKPDTPRVQGLRTALSTLDELLEKGKTLGPKATGPISGRMLTYQGNYGIGGKGDQELMAFQSKLSRLAADQMHSLYGGALTPGELERSKTWAPNVNIPWEKNQANLQALRDYTASLLGMGPSANQTAPIILNATPKGGRSSGPGR